MTTRERTFKGARALLVPTSKGTSEAAAVASTKPIVILQEFPSVVTGSPGTHFLRMYLN